MPSVPRWWIRPGTMSDRQRLIVAVLLILVVWFVPMLIWPAKRPVGRVGGRADSTAVHDTAQRAPARPSAPTAATPSRPAARPHPPQPPPAQPPLRLLKTLCGLPDRGSGSASARVAAASSRQN